MKNHSFEIAVVGAGVAGLTCARHLQATGRSVVVLDKSRGVGGRMATRRVQGSYADHGLRYLEADSEGIQALIQLLLQQGILQRWTDEVYQLGADRVLQRPAERRPRYIAPGGMTAIAKHLATDLTLQLGQRVRAITLTEQQTWLLQVEATANEPTTLEVGAVVLMLPAPQILDLLEPIKTILPPTLVGQLQSVTFNPCITAIAGYPLERQQDLEASGPEWRAVEFTADANLRWVGWDSSKRTNAEQPIFVFHSSVAFATRFLETTELQSAGQTLLTSAARDLLAWLETPLWLQVHRWRYAFPRQALNQAYLGADIPVPLICGGDWCGGKQVESALLSGLAAAQYLSAKLR